MPRPRSPSPTHGEGLVLDGLLVTQSEGVAVNDPRIVAIPLSTLMLLR
jgi:hypothetical protein